MDIIPVVKERARMDDVLSEFGLQKDRYNNILCPFHSDRKPSCKVYEKSFYCWACGTGGDCIKFVALYLGMSNIDAARHLARMYGIETDRPETKEERAARVAKEIERQREELFQNWVDSAFHCLHLAKRVLRERWQSGDNEAWALHHQYESLIDYYLDCLEEDPKETYHFYREEVFNIGLKAISGCNKG